MSTDHGWKLRLAVLSTLVKNGPQSPGRTALMKFAYLLQVVRGVPLGYRFSLYNYGPYDSTVLSDVSQAETLKAVKSEVVTYPTGYGYQYRTNEKGHAALCRNAEPELERYRGDIDWVLREFGDASASRLEVVSTVIFAEREMQRKHQPATRDELTRRVSQIKPNINPGVIAQTVDELAEKRLIALHAA